LSVRPREGTLTPMFRALSLAAAVGAFLLALGILLTTASAVAYSTAGFFTRLVYEGV